MIINHSDHTHIYTTMCDILKSYIWRDKKEAKVEISQISKWHFKINVHTNRACMLWFHLYKCKCVWIWYWRDTWNGGHKNVNCDNINVVRFKVNVFQVNVEFFHN